MNLSKTLIAVGAVALVSVGIIAFHSPKEDLTMKKYPESKFVSTLNNQSEKKVFDKQAEVSVSSPEEVNHLIPSQANFDLHFDQEVTDEYVINTFSLSPQKELSVTKINPKYYQLTVVNELDEDQIYNVVEKTNAGIKKWAFQTERTFAIEYTYPNHHEMLTETGVPEIRFNSKLDENTKLSQYITIEPKISGRWESSYTYQYRFEHDAHFEKNKTYTITVKKGLKDIDGNELKEDYVFDFSISNQNQSDFAANLVMLNQYQPNMPIDMNLSLSLSMNKALSVKEANLKIINLRTKENYIQALKNINSLEEVTKYYQEKLGDAIYSKDLKGDINHIYEEAKAEKRYYYYEEVPIDASLTIDEEGYYLAVLNFNDTMSSVPFEVNESTATCSTLADDNFMILYKGKDGKNNRVDVYFNTEKLGTTSQDGVLYVEGFRNTIHEVEKEVNYIEFIGGNTHLICDVSSQVSSEYQGENRLTSLNRFNNGYLYVDRNYYKVGEIIHFWGYAKNRKTEIKNASLKITSNYDDVLAEIPLALNEVGAFEGEYEISEVNKESYLSLVLKIGEEAISSRYVEIRDYALKQYDISITPEKTDYLDGDTATIQISAATFDGTPLPNLEFAYDINNRYYYNEAKSSKGTVTTDDSGNASILVPLRLDKREANILPETVRVDILNSYIDGEQESVYFTVYPYKHYADGSAKKIMDENKYYLNFHEYLSLDREIPANDSIKVIAKAFKTVKNITGTRYNQYTKEMEDVIEYREVAEPSYNKTFIVNMTNGEGNYELPNYKKDKNCYYQFYAYLMTDTGKELALNYEGQIYAYSYQTITSRTQYEEVEYVAPIITPELTYTLVYETNDELRVGDEVYFYLQDSEGRRLNDYSMFEFYTLIVSADGNHIHQNKGERPHFTYTKEMGANVSTYTILYDSLKTYSPVSNNRLYYSKMFIADYFWRPSSQIRLCEEELSLDVSITFDKEIYEPKEEAEITIQVMDHGKGIKAGVNLAALDSAYIAMNGAVSTDIISSLYNSYYISSSTNQTRTFSTNAKSVQLNGVAESAMASDMSMEDEAYTGNTSIMARDDLRTTAFFQSVVTDENGLAKVKIKLPDNITEWTVKVQAISNDMKAKSTEEKIKVSKDFFVNVNHKDRYLVGEAFAFNIKNFSKTKVGKESIIKVEILSENGTVLEEKVIPCKVNDVMSYKIQNPILEKGIYQIRITGNCENLQDILVDEIEISESLLDATIREKLVINIGDKIAIVSPKGYLYILNTDIAKVLPTIMELSHLYHAERNDTNLISSEAWRIFDNLVNGVAFEYAQMTSYGMEKSIFKVMNNSSDDARLALRMLATKVYRIDSEGVLEKIENKLGSEAALWAKVNMNQASIKELQEKKEAVMKNSKKYTKENVMYLALAFADIGSFDDAKEVYDIVSEQITEKDEIEFELKVILAIKLNLNEMEELYQSYIAKDLLPENCDFVKLYYVQNAVSKNYKKGRMTLKINGNIEEVEIKNVGLTRKLIARKDTIELVSMSDNLELMMEQYKPVDFDEIPKGNYILSKNYSKENAKLGELLEVTIKLNAKKLYDDGHKYGFKLEDAIPNNMTFVEYLYGSNTNGYLRKQDGQKLTISVWNPYDPKYNPSATTITVKYQVRVTNDGEQYEPGTILLKYDDEILEGQARCH